MARWLLRITIATIVVVVGLALAATSAQADVKSDPLGTVAKKLTQTHRPAAGTATKVKTVRSKAPKIAAKTKAAPVRRVARKAAPVRTYRAAKATRTVARKATAVRPRISTVQRKTSPRPAVRAVRATSPKARPAQRAKTSPTKINSRPSKIIKSSIRKATTAHSLPVPAVGTPEIKVTVGDSIELSAPPVALRIPLLSIPTVTLPPVELPTVTIPGTELPRVILPPRELPTAGRPQREGAAAGPISSLDERARTVDGTASGHASQVEAAHRPLGLVAGGSTVMTAYTALRLSLDTGVMRAIGPPAVDILDQLGQRIQAVEVPASVGPTTALIIAAALAAATGTVSSGSTGGGGLAIVPATIGLPALGGSRRRNGRLRESAFGTPCHPGFSPD